MWFYRLIAVTDLRNDDFMTSSLRYTLQMGTLGWIMVNYGLIAGEIGNSTLHPKDVGIPSLFGRFHRQMISNACQERIKR